MKYVDLLRIAVKNGFSVVNYLKPMDPVTKGFHQEALFNIFYLFWSRTRNILIPSGGNFSGNTLLTIQFDMAKYINQNVRTGGDISDFTMIDNKNKKLIVFSSKCMAKYGGRGMDIEKINENEYKEYAIEVRLVVHSKEKFLLDMKKQRNTTPDRSNHVLYDWTDIQNMIDAFEGDVSSVNKICSLYTSKYVKMHLRFGQYIVSMCVADLLKKHKRVINGSICRFGKTYCMAFDILKSDFGVFVFITSQPKTISAISSIFNKYDDFKDYKLFNFNNGRKSIDAFNKIKEIKHKTVVFVSIQTLKSGGKGKLIKNLENFKSMCLIDEFHDSGETFETTKVMKKHNLLKSPIVFYSATYEKIKSFYNIPNDAIVSWGIEDNIWCSDVVTNIELLRKKYGSVVDDALKVYNVKEIEDHYSTLPRLKFIIDKPSQKCFDGFEIKNKTDKTLGYSFDAVKMIKLVGNVEGTSPNVKKYELVNEDAVVSYFQRLLGGGSKDEAFGVYVPQNGMIDIYKKLCDTNDQKYGKIIPVYMGNGIVEGEQKDSSETLIHQCVECIIACLLKYRKTKLKGLDNYALINYNTDTKDPESWFDQIVAENPEKTIVLFLGSSLTTGITNRYCDLIKLTRRINSHDLFWQTICRAMNESVERNKKYAYICVDDYQSLGGLLSIVKHMKYDGESEACAWKRLMKQNIFNIVDVNYDGQFVDTEIYEPLFENMYEMVRNATPYNDNLRRYVDGIDFGDIKLLSKYLVNLFKKDTHGELKKMVERLEELKTKGIEKGIEVEKIEKKIKEKEEGVAVSDENNCQEMLSVLLTTYVMLTIEVKDINIVDIVDYLEKKNRLSIMIERCCKSFGVDVDGSIATILKLNTVLMDEKNVNIINEMLMTLKEQLRFDKSKQECYLVCQEVIMTTDIERKQNAEVLTPLPLVNEMMSKIPTEAWTDMSSGDLPKIFDPCVGKGAFVVVIYDLLWKKLEDLIPDEEERRVTILEEMIYFADINPFNIHVTKMILDPAGKYKLNYYTGDTLKMIPADTWDFDKFDIIVGNPPYNSSSGNKGSGHNIWVSFVKICLMNWLKHQGYLSFVHPQGWRQLGNAVGALMLSKQLVYLNMNDVVKGQAVFNCSTTFDYYVLYNVDNHTETLINDYKNKEYLYNLKEVKFIPNHSIDIVNDYINYNGKNGLMCDQSTYEIRKEWMSKIKNDIFKYPCVYSINKNNELSLIYSKVNNKGHFGVTKFIVSNGSGFYKDVDGNHGCTQWSYYIKCKKEDMGDIEKCFNNSEFLNIINAVKLTSNKYNYVVLKYLKKDFWKAFV